MSQNKSILLGVTGSIAGYKACELVRLLRQEGHQVQVVMSSASSEFIHHHTFQALSGKPVVFDDATQASSGMAHIDLTRQADLFLIAPATANTLAKIAHGIADNLITNLVSARTCPLVVAPAMNVQMWNNPANLRNIKQLEEDGVTILYPSSGSLACGEFGVGRMLEPIEIMDLLPDIGQKKTLKDKRVLITAGGTYEAIDPVRGITNISSGRMGMALARACRAVGARVSLVYGSIQVALPTALAEYHHTISAKEMYDKVESLIDDQDIFISVAAVADYRVQQQAEHKIKKTGQAPTLILEENPDILAMVASRDNPPFCVGFSAESQDVVNYARDKMRRKNIPMIVANNVAYAMNQPTTRMTIIDNTTQITLTDVDKYTASQKIVECIANHLATWKAS